jgi:hypothetical protein
MDGWDDEWSLAQRWLRVGCNWGRRVALATSPSTLARSATRVRLPGWDRITSTSLTAAPSSTRPGPHFSFQSAGATWSSDGTATFENQGTLTKVAGSGTTNLGAFLINSGSVQANAGMWQITGGGTATGSFTVAAGATLQFGGGSSFAFNSGSSVAGAGTVDFSGSYYASFASGSTYDVTGATQSDSSIVAFLAGSSVSRPPVL